MDLEGDKVLQSLGTGGFASVVFVRLAARIGLTMISGSVVACASHSNPRWLGMSSLFESCERPIMSNYGVIIYWSNEDGAFVAEAPELAGCTAHGPTQEEALRSAQQAIQLWIDSAIHFGDLVPEPKGRRLELR